MARHLGWHGVAFGGTLGPVRLGGFLLGIITVLGNLGRVTVRKCS